MDILFYIEKPINSDRFEYIDVKYAYKRFNEYNITHYYYRNRYQLYIIWCFKYVHDYYNILLYIENDHIWFDSSYYVYICIHFTYNYPNVT